MKALGTAHRELVNDNLGYVRALAAKHYPAYADCMDYDDLVGSGLVGLCTAARRFRKNRGARFTTYAHWRVHGAILDGARRERVLPRLDQFPGGGEFETDTPVEAAVHAFAPHPETLDEELDRRRDNAALKAALARLPDEKRRLLELHFFHDLTLEQAGRKLGVSKSWASRMLAKTLESLKQELTADR
jgi:RNA polymerase sigma factor (sigma-70 family)